MYKHLIIEKTHYDIILTNENNINLIDFGDMCETFVVCEPAIARAYIMLDKENPIESAANLIQGYNQIYSLEQVEIDFIYYFIRIRLGMSVTISAHQKKFNRIIIILLLVKNQLGLY